MISLNPIRSALFVPGSRPERFDKALATGADRVIVDFEDAVEEALKAHARSHLAAYLNDRPDVRVAVRINAVGHPEHLADLAFCTTCPGVVAVMLPKAESKAQLEAVARCGKPLWPLIESAQGVLAIAEIAGAAGVERLTFGALDLGFDLGLKAGSNAAHKVMDHVRYAMLLASVNAGLAKPLDTIFTHITDLEGLAQMAGEGRDMGLCGMLCIHPAQVGPVNQAYSPTPEELDWARRVIEAARTQSAGAFRLDGRMVDAPVIRQAQRLVDSQGLE